MGDTIKKAIRMLFTREMLSYIFFGICTTVVNIVVFQACTALLHWNWAVSNVLAWILSVLFAFVTNKLFVFQSKKSGSKRFIWEAVTFFAARVLSLGIDMAGMWLLLDCLNVNSLLSKILMNVVVIIVNYILSKFIIFRKKVS
ncbi:MAG: GtrA family protein [Hydrogeniiclostridium sp.]